MHACLSTIDVILTSHTNSFDPLEEYLRSLDTPEMLATNKKSTGEEKEDSKKRKPTATAKESTGVAKLKKVNTKGMAKMSSFFTKKK